MASIARNNTKLNIRYAHYMTLHSSILCTNSSLGCAAMPLLIDFHQTEYMRDSIETTGGNSTEIISIMFFKLVFYIYIEESFVMATTY